MEEESELQIYTKSRLAWEKVLDLNMTEDELHSKAASAPHLVWKVLILDEYSEQSLATLFHLGDLRMHNITLHIPLHAERDPLHNVMAIYVMEPTDRNISRLLQDCREHCYDHIQINFLHPADSLIMQSLAAGLSSEGALHKLHRLYEQYLRYIYLEDNLFTLNGPSFQALNEPGKSDSEVEMLLEQVAMSLFCMFHACGVWPIIRASKGVCEQVAERVADLCGSVADSSQHLSRPLLLLVDRHVDLPIMLHHPWSYQSLAIDLFRTSLNKILIPDNNPPVQELDKRRDNFWKEQSVVNFGDAIQNIDALYKDWLGKYQNINMNLMKTMDTVSEVTEQKSQVDLHMSLGTKIAHQIQKRSLDKFNELEENLMQKKRADIGELLSKPVPEGIEAEVFENDKLRVQAIAYLTKSISELPDQGLQSVLTTITRQEEEQTVSSFMKLADMVKSSISGMVSMYPLTKLLHSALENKNKDLVYIDSKFRHSTQVYKRPFSDAVVFVLGGGCYSEYHNVLEYAKKSNKNIIYGASEIVNGTQFLTQLQNLAKKSI
jgi:hypothetical protein